MRAEPPPLRTARVAWHNPGMNACRALLSLVLLALGACAMPGYGGTWMPDAVELTVAAEDGAPIAQLRVSVPGQWQGSPADGELRVLLAVENGGKSPRALPPGRAELILGDKRSCGSARNVAGAETTVPPGQSVLLELGFMPPEDAELDELLVRWVL